MNNFPTGVDDDGLWFAGDVGQSGTRVDAAPGAQALRLPILRSGTTVRPLTVKRRCTNIPNSPAWWKSPVPKSCGWTTRATGLADAMFTHDPLFDVKPRRHPPAHGQAAARKRKRRCTRQPTRRPAFRSWAVSLRRAPSKVAIASGSTPKRWSSAVACAPMKTASPS